jgi:hypothetical protein
MAKSPPTKEQSGPLGARSGESCFVPLHAAQAIKAAHTAGLMPRTFCCHVFRVKDLLVSIILIDSGSIANEFQRKSTPLHGILI